MRSLNQHRHIKNGPVCDLTTNTVTFRTVQYAITQPTPFHSERSSMRSHNQHRHVKNGPVCDLTTNTVTLRTVQYAISQPTSSHSERASTRCHNKYPDLSLGFEATFATLLTKQTSLPKFLKPSFVIIYPNLYHKTNN